MLTRDRLLARIAEMGAAPDHQQLAAEVLGIRNAPPELARRLVAQALVVEDRQDTWRRTGERIAETAPAAPGVYILRDEDGAPLYVGKAVNLRRRLRAHFARRRWRAIKPAMSRIAGAEWQLVGSELEALLREAALIHELRPVINIQTAAPTMDGREIPSALRRDVLVLLPSVEQESVELVGARVDGTWLLQRTRRDGAELLGHAQRMMRFFRSALRRRDANPPLAPIVFSWLAGRGSHATRLDPAHVVDARGLRTRLTALFRDERLFYERIDQRHG